MISREDLVRQNRVLCDAVENRLRLERIRNHNRKGLGSTLFMPKYSIDERIEGSSLASSSVVLVTLQRSSPESGEAELAIAVSSHRRNRMVLPIA